MWGFGSSVVRGVLLDGGKGRGGIERSGEERTDRRVRRGRSPWWARWKGMVGLVVGWIAALRDLSLYKATVWGMEFCTRKQSWWICACSLISIRIEMGDANPNLG